MTKLICILESIYVILIGIYYVGISLGGLEPFSLIVKVILVVGSFIGSGIAAVHEIRSVSRGSQRLLVLSILLPVIANMCLVLPI